MPHGAKPPNGESLETQKPKCPLSDSRRSVGSPRGVHFSFCFPKLSPPPFFFFLRFLSSFFSPFFSSPQCILCWPLLLLAPSALAAKAAGGSRRPAECVLGTCLVILALFRGPFPHPPWAAVPSVCHFGPWCSHGSPLVVVRVRGPRVGSGFVTSGRLWAKFPGP